MQKINDKNGVTVLDGNAWLENENILVKILKTDGHKCPRCWKTFKDNFKKELCVRCEKVIDENF